MKIDRDNNTSGLRKATHNDYGIVDMPRPDDVLYKLTFNKKTRILHINGKAFMRLKLGFKADLMFLALFKKRGNPKRVILEKKEDAYYIIRNLGLPDSLSSAIFNTYLAGKKIEVYTEITRERAHEFKLDHTEIMDFLHEKNDYYNRLIH